MKLSDFIVIGYSSKKGYMADCFILLCIYYKNDIVEIFITIQIL